MVVMATIAVAVEGVGTQPRPVRPNLTTVAAPAHTPRPTRGPGRLRRPVAGPPAVAGTTMRGAPCGAFGAPTAITVAHLPSPASVRRCVNARTERGVLRPLLGHTTHRWLCLGRTSPAQTADGGGEGAAPVGHTRPRRAAA